MGKWSGRLGERVKGREWKGGEVEWKVGRECGLGSGRDGRWGGAVGWEWEGSGGGVDG